MKNKLLMLVVLLIINIYSSVGLAKNITVKVSENNSEITYAFSSLTNTLSIIKDGAENKIPLREEDNGNSSIWFDIFNQKPSLWYESDAQTNYSAHAILKYINQKLYIDCIYANIRTGTNGLVIRKAECGLNEMLVDNGNDFVSDKIESWKSVYEMFNTKHFLDGELKELSIVIWRNKDFYIYTQYKYRNELLSAKPNTFIYGRNGVYNFGGKVVYFVFDKNSKNLLHIDVTGDSEGKMNTILKPDSFASLKYNRVNLQDTGLYYINVDRAPLYDKSHSVTKMYLVNNDVVSLIDMTVDGYWCSIRYVTVSNKIIDAWLPCNDIHQ